MHKTLTVFSGATTAPEFDRPRPDRLVAGNPLRTTREHFERDGMSAGTWSCEPGAWRIAFAEGTDEFFHVISGRIRITDEAGTAREFGPGEACVIPSGFTGLFEVLEPVTKHYVFMRRPTDSA
ncbi:DUF861 domain-containing protein [Thauera sp. CAU 1555]|uniref:DUF861 domain-containing protein n=1 Tax=Thauera sedimentorum TaxID=2767595 RepID=A0ABR9BAN7_9RHOO|nr:cupin domain-containing protein [Thauera sedimentorum]MBC9072494.1 DUF861 domain-containing protein [Thauera sedimentorum]MBD8503413.1 DUF861 domain-containing protein [Thauera sedimentorum]